MSIHTFHYFCEVIHCRAGHSKCHYGVIKVVCKNEVLLFILHEYRCTPVKKNPIDTIFGNML